MILICDYNEVDNLLKSISNLSQITGIVISTLTLYLAFRISKLFFSNHLKSKQIDHVCSLIEALNKSKIEIAFAKYEGDETPGGSSGYAIFFNLFEIGKYDEFEPEGLNLIYEDQPVLFDRNSNQLLDFKMFIDHPLTPTNIADELLKFYNTSCSYLGPEIRPDQLSEYVLLTTNIIDPNIIFNKTKNGFLIEGNAIVFKTWLNLKESSKSLKKVIGNWLMSNGIKENNIRQDFKN